MKHQLTSALVALTLAGCDHLCPPYGDANCMQPGGGSGGQYGEDLQVVDFPLDPCQALAGGLGAHVYEHDGLRLREPVDPSPYVIGWGPYGGFGFQTWGPWTMSGTGQAALAEAARIFFKNDIQHSHAHPDANDGHNLTVWAVADGPGAFRRDGVSLGGDPGQVVPWVPVAQLGTSAWRLVVADFGEIDSAWLDYSENYRMDPEPGTMVLGRTFIYAPDEKPAKAAHLPEDQGAYWFTGASNVWDPDVSFPPGGDYGGKRFGWNALNGYCVIGVSPDVPGLDSSGGNANAVSLDMIDVGYE